MPTRKTDLYLLKCLTNLHAGSGAATYGLVDKEVQRDPLHELPVIHSSGIKGSFRELLTTKDADGKDLPSAAVSSIFGSGKEDGQKPENKLSPGSHIFYEAHLLVLPVRSNIRPFFRALCPMVVSDLIARTTMAKVEGYKHLSQVLNKLATGKPDKGRPWVFQQTDVEVELDNWKFKAVAKTDINISDAEAILGANLALFNDDDFKELTKELPVIARNQLENGISNNLWYEEVVPRETVFQSFVSYAEGETYKLWTEIEQQGNSLIQIGGNASVGYGLCELNLWNGVSIAPIAQPQTAEV